MLDARFQELRDQDEIDGPPAWFAWLFIASAVAYGYAIGWAIVALLKWLL